MLWLNLDCCGLGCGCEEEHRERTREESVPCEWADAHIPGQNSQWQYYNER